MPLHLNENLLVAEEGTVTIDVASLSSYPARGNADLRDAITETHGVEPGHVTEGLGAAGILNRCFGAFANCGAVAVMPSPGWSYYDALIASHDIRACPVALRSTPTGFEYDVDSVIAAVRAHSPSLVVLTSPNNPTGGRLSYREVLSIARGAPDCLVVIDEAYHGFVDDDPVSIASLLSGAPNVMLIRSMSKAYGLAGLRVGFALSGEMGTAILNRSPVAFGLPSFVQTIAAMRLRDSGWLPRVRHARALSINALVSSLRPVPEVFVYSTDANFALVRLPKGRAAFAEGVLASAGYLVKTIKSNPLQDHLRITLAPPDVMRSVAGCLRDSIRLEACA